VIILTQPLYFNKMFINGEKMNENKNKNKKLKLISVIIGGIITIMIILVVMININGNELESHNRRLVISDSTTSSSILLNTNISIINIDLYSGSRSISCYTNESSLYYVYSNTLTVSCTTLGYQLTGCSSTTDAYSYGVYSDGNSCYTERSSHGPSEFPNELFLQARCCKSNKDILNIEYITKLNQDIIKNSCNELKCLYSNQTSMGSAIMLGTNNNNNGYSQNKQQNQGNIYIDTSLSSSIFMNSGNITTSKIGLFCGNIKNNYNLKCITAYGNIAINNGGYSSVNCTSGYKLTACDIQSSDFTCSTSNINGYISGSYIDDNTCIGYGNYQRAVARCCTVA